MKNEEIVITVSSQRGVSWSGEPIYPDIVGLLTLALWEVQKSLERSIKEAQKLKRSQKAVASRSEGKE